MAMSFGEAERPQISKKLEKPCKSWKILVFMKK